MPEDPITAAARRQVLDCCPTCALALPHQLPRRGSLLDYPVPKATAKIIRCGINSKTPQHCNKGA